MPNLILRKWQVYCLLVGWLKPGPNCLPMYRENFAQEIADLRKGKAPARSSPVCGLDPYVDNEGLLRIKERLEIADLF